MTAEHAHGIDTGGEVEARIAAGRIKHGVGASKNFPGNVCHLVSPIVGGLRLRQRDGSPVNDIGWIIDRLSLVLDMARWEAEHNAAADAVLAEARRLCCGNNPAAHHAASAKHSELMAFAGDLARAVRGLS